MADVLNGKLLLGVNWVSTLQQHATLKTAADQIGVDALRPTGPGNSTALTNSSMRSSPRSGSRSARPSGGADGAVPFVGLAVACGIAVGWARHDRTDLVAYEGLGYALGVAGLSMMSVLLLYSLRKRWRPLQRAGSAPLWLQIHMTLGLLGPAAILFHANFRLGSLNSRMALFCMATVSLSGVVGRFLYTRIHSASFDQRKTIADFHASGLPVLDAATRTNPKLGTLLGDFRNRALDATAMSWVARAGAFLWVGADARKARRRGLTIYRCALSRQSVDGVASVSEVKRCLRRYVGRVRTLARLNVYERAFALWHAMHLPFCVVLFGAAAVHVIAVHMY
jgi:hypothetical protein